MICFHLDLDKHVWSASIPMRFYDLFLVKLLFGIKNRVKFYSEGDSKYFFFFISSDHNLNINRFSADGIMIG